MINVGITGGGKGKIAHVTDENALLVSVIPPPLLQSNSFGKVNTGGAGSGNLIAVRNTTYTEPLTAAQRSINSANANDTFAGTGAQVIRLTYYDELLNGPFVENIPLNGLAVVPTANSNICFIESMEVIRVGSGGTNAGIITLHVTAGGAGTIGTIATGTGLDLRTYWAHHYVPGNRKVKIGAFDCGTQGNQNAEAFLKLDNPLIANTPEEQFIGSVTVGLNSQSTVRILTPQFLVLGPARITLYIIPAGNNTNFYGSFDWGESDLEPGDQGFSIRG